MQVSSYRMGVFWLLLLSVSALGVSPGRGVRGRHVFHVEGAPVPVGLVSVVVPEESRLLRFAAQELQDLLGESLGLPVPVFKRPARSGISLVLGDNALSRKAGLDVSRLPREGYVIRRQGSCVYLAGRDSKTSYPQQNRWGQCYERGTLSAVYDFLERFVGVRFYFPGKIGTVVPKVSTFALPPVMEIEESPDFSDRRFSHIQGRWYESPEVYGGVKGMNLNLLRLRTSERYVPYGHGLVYLRYLQRMKDHPEYFALCPDGRRHCIPGMTHTGQFCFNSGIREQIYRDARAYFSGQKPPQGMSWWDVNVAMDEFFCVMPQDWLYWCGCEACRKIARPGRLYDSWTSEERQRISDFIWGMTGELANRLRRDGFKAVVTQMAYDPYDRVPRCDVPGNVQVQLALSGPWSSNQTSSDEALRRWVKKLGRKVSLWTYAGKYGSRAFPGVPALTPWAVGHYFQDRRNLITGTFMESETDQYLFHALNYYVLAKVGWNADTDVDALLEEHCRLMYGKGAPMMLSVYKRLERLWIDGVVGNVVNTGLGPQSKLPSTYELWTKVYSDEELAGLSASVASALKAASGDASATARLRFMGEKLLQPLLDSAEQFRKDRLAIGNWRVQVPGKIGLRPCEGDVNEVETLVEIKELDKHFVFIFDCHEPEMKRNRSVETESDRSSLWSDSCVEVFLNPSGDRKHYFHFMVNSKGVYADSFRRVHEKEDYGWNSGMRIRTSEGKDSWMAEIYVPKDCLGEYDRRGFPVNFARHRVLTGQAPKLDCYQWCPVPSKTFHDLAQYGVMELAHDDDGNLVKDGDFDCIRESDHRLGEWFAWHSGKRGGGQSIDLDGHVFITTGRSVHLRNVAGQRMNVVQLLPKLKAHCRYRLSYYLRTEKLVPFKGKGGAGAYFSAGPELQKGFPAVPVSGTAPWHRLSFEFETGDLKGNHKTILGLWIWHAGGEAWFDQVRLEEVK